MSSFQNHNEHTAELNGTDANGLSHAPESSSRLPAAQSDAADRDVNVNTPASDSVAVRQDPDACTAPQAEIEPACDSS